MRGRVWPVVLLSSAWALCAEPNDAERLFREARGLLAQKNYLEACPLFEQSQRLEPALGTLLNLADCFEKTERLPEAYWAFLGAQAQAKSKQDARREETAKARVDALRARLVLVRIEQVEPGCFIEVERQRDAKLAYSGEVSSAPLALEPGDYRLRVHVTGRPPFERSLSVRGAGGSTSVAVVLPAVASVLAPPEAELPPPPLMPVSQPLAEPKLRPLAVVGLVAGGALLIGAGIGIGYSQDVVTRVARQQPGGPDVNAPTVTRRVYETAQVLYPLAVGAAALGVSAVVLSLVFAKAPQVSVALLPNAAGGLVAQAQVAW